MQTYLHAVDADIPALNNLSLCQAELERLAILARIENLREGLGER